MSIRKMALVAAIGASLASAPVMAQTANMPSAATAPRSGTDLQDASAQRGGFPFLIVFVVIAVGLGLYFAVVDDNETRPTSP